MSMDVCSRIGLSVTDNVNDLRGLCMNTLESTHGVLKVLSVDELGVGVSEFLNIQDSRKEDPSSSPPRESCNIQEKGVSDKSPPIKIATGAPEKSLSKCATFPCSSMTLSSPPDAITSEVSTHDENVKSLDPSGFRSISLPTGLKPVSAMKGSREKRGAAPAEKLRVKWAPDVYDPVPSSVSHVVTNNRRHSSSKKSSRNKQKKPSRGSKGKEKKQVRKRGGSGSSTKVEVEEEEVVDYPELFCGSSFLKRYGTGLHISSVAEAT